MKNKKHGPAAVIITVSAVVVIAAAAAALFLLGRGAFGGSDYTIPEVDLSRPDRYPSGRFDELTALNVVDDSDDYLAHPDSVLLKDGSIFTVFPLGHGKGSILARYSDDLGKSWKKWPFKTPDSWQNSLETPTVFRLCFTDGSEKLLLVSGNPKWPGMSTDGGFNCSLSDDEAKTWTEFATFFDKNSDTPVVPIVAMASLVRLKENGRFVDKWMGFFHDADFFNYSTVLSFDDDGQMRWSAPKKYFSAYREIEKRSNMCEVCVIRSDGGKGSELCLISRSNTKRMNSLVSFPPMRVSPGANRERRRLP